MPELPEVETIVRQLRRKVLGKEISNVIIMDNLVVSDLVKKSVGSTITDIYRKAKMLVFCLSDGNYLLTSLRMTGHFRYNQDDKFMVGKFSFKDGTFLSHHSIRRFGFVEFLNKKELDFKISKLGYEPLSKEFTLSAFNNLMNKKQKSNIKNILMDQYQIVGIGNIYAQEALYLASIDPRLRVGEISEEKLSNLHSYIISVLTSAIDQNGTTVENYSNLEGSGNYQNKLVVYGKTKCPKNHDLTKISLGGRGTRFCDVCQI